MKRHSLRRKALPVAVLTSLCVFGTGGAFAQDNAAANAASEEQESEADATSRAVALETVVVTARKREEELQRTPQAITAFTAAQIRKNGIERIGDVANLTTGLNFSPIFGSVVATPIIRGSAQTFGAPNVGVFLDGVYLTGKAAVDISLADLERIEVVKGPQSSLYGRNSFAGAINYITRRPSFDPKASVSVTGGSDGLREGIASYSGPINDQFAFRVAGRWFEHDGFFESSLDGGQIDFEESRSITADLLFQGDSPLSILFRGSYTDDDSGQPASQVVRANGLPRVTPIIPPSTGLGLNQTFVGRLPNSPQALAVNTTRLNELHDYGYRETTSRFSAHVDYSFDTMALTSITAWNRRDTEYQFDGDNTVCDRPSCPNFGPPIAGGTSRFATSSEDGRLDDLSQEFRLTSMTDSPLQWLAGLYWYSSDSDAIQRSLAPIGSQATFGFPRIQVDTTSTAVFGSVSYAFNEAWRLSVEGRYEREDQEFNQRPTVTAGVPPTSTSLVVFDLEQDFSFFAPRIVLDYKPDEQSLYYANVAKGVKAGGFNTNLRIFDNQRTFEEESQVTFEIGAKHTWLDNRLQSSAALYTTDWDDQQIACQNPASLFPGATSTQRTYVCNVGEAKINGLELDLTFAVTEYVRLRGGWAYTEARYKAFVDESLAATLTQAGLPPFQFRNRYLPYVPRNVFFGVLDVDVPVTGEVDFFANWSLNRASKQYLRADNLAYIDDRLLSNLRLGVRTGPWTVTGFANNLFDDNSPITGVRFFDSVNFSVPAPLVTWAQPRQVGITLRYDFR
jgi:iron complex outermembrane receptor protein